MNIKVRSTQSLVTNEKLGLSGLILYQLPISWPSTRSFWPMTPSELAARSSWSLNRRPWSDCSSIPVDRRTRTREARVWIRANRPTMTLPKNESEVRYAWGQNTFFAWSYGSTTLTCLLGILLSGLHDWSRKWYRVFKLSAVCFLTPYSRTINDHQDHNHTTCGTWDPAASKRVLLVRELHQSNRQPRS